MSRVNLSDCIKQMREEAESTNPCREQNTAPERQTDLSCTDDAQATKPQEPTAFVYDTGYEGQVAIKFITGKWAADGTVLFTTPQHCLKATDSGLYTEAYVTELRAKCAELEAEVLSKEGMALVTKEDAENYCRILSLLGMEEEGSPIEGVEHLISLRDGMTCGDCNDTGWLENREEGRYPCTCMTEAEPYQILEAERDDWKSRYESNLSVNQMHSDNNAEMLKFTAKLLADIDALKKQNNAYATLTKAQEGRLVEYGSEKAKWLDAVATLDSEKEANAILTQERDALKAENIALIGAGLKNEAERGSDGFLMVKIADLVQERDALAMQNQQMREALKLAAKTISDLETSGDLDTETIPTLMEALSLPDNTEAIIKRHDAAVLRKAADTTLSEQSVLLDGMHGYTALKIQGLMIESLHLKADELEKS